ncbi:FlgB family protein [Paracoccus liaowanqingii]|uniref:FlgB family protein n=1 Tax=Paracoccus liaowanqingii TaxID=2560053 RepID=A0A4P7HIY9_9RHOB|nr:FlgB family protein [Paracoccus liaowanqingii]QBX33540.1 FlgB family protein [Paracoccus liaowanqingii]
MFDQIEMMRMARAMGLHVQQRHVEVARNIANADTPGYRATDLQDFAQTYRRDDGSGPLKVSHPRHLASPDWSPAEARVIQVAGPVSPNGNSVSLEEEMVRAAEVKRHHDLSLAVYRSGLDLMRASLGRR